MTRALTLDMLLCVLALTVCGCHPSPDPPVPQTSRAKKATAVFAKVAVEFKCPAPPGRFMIGDGTNHSSEQPVRTSCITVYATRDAQSYAVLDHYPDSQMFDQRPSICVMKDACDEIKS